MTLERSDPRPDNVPETIKWLMDRMWKFYDASRLYAVNADQVREDFIREYGHVQGNVLCDSDAMYMGCVAQQQMYTSWAQREATLLQTLVTVRSHATATRQKGIADGYS